jgi:hypothetical protein
LTPTRGMFLTFRRSVVSRPRRLTLNLIEVGALGVVGYSAGGLSAIRVANGRGLQAVDLVVQLDSYDPLTGSSVEDEILPGNVVRGINYYQLANRFNPFRPGFDPFDLQGARVVQGAENINAEDLLGDRGITHRTLDDNPGLHSQILRDIEVNVLQDLKFDRAGQLSLGGGAQLTNNILALAPDGNGGAGQALINDTFAIDAGLLVSDSLRVSPACGWFTGGFVLD